MDFAVDQDNGTDNNMEIADFRGRNSGKGIGNNFRNIMFTTNVIFGTVGFLLLKGITVDTVKNLFPTIMPLVLLLLLLLQTNFIDCPCPVVTQFNTECFGFVLRATPVQSLASEKFKKNIWVRIGMIFRLHLEKVEMRHAVDLQGLATSRMQV